MFQTSGYFKAVTCPYFTSGLCERPYCHFRHVKPTSDEKSSASSLWSNTVALSAAGSSGDNGNSSLLAKVGETIQKLQRDIERDQQLLNGHKTVRPKSIEAFAGTVVDKYRSRVTLSDAKPTDSKKPTEFSYEPTPISELEKKRTTKCKTKVENSKERPQIIDTEGEYEPQPKKPKLHEFDEEAVGKFSEGDSSQASDDEPGALFFGKSKASPEREHEEKDVGKDHELVEESTAPGDILSQIIQDSNKSLNLTTVKHKNDGSMVILDEKKNVKKKRETRKELSKLPTAAELCLELSDEEMEGAHESEETLEEMPAEEVPEIVEEPKPTPEELAAAKKRDSVWEMINSGAIVLGHIPRNEEPREKTNEKRTKHEVDSDNIVSKNISEKSDHDDEHGNKRGSHSSHSRDMDDSNKKRKRHDEQKVYKDDEKTTGKVEELAKGRSKIDVERDGKAKHEDNKSASEISRTTDDSSTSDSEHRSKRKKSKKRKKRQKKHRKKKKKRKKKKHHKHVSESESGSEPSDKSYDEGRNLSTGKCRSREHKRTKKRKHSSSDTSSDSDVSSESHHRNKTASEECVIEKAAPVETDVDKTRTDVTSTVDLPKERLIVKSVGGESGSIVKIEKLDLYPGESSDKDHHLHLPTPHSSDPSTRTPSKVRSDQRQSGEQKSFRQGNAVNTRKKPKVKTDKSVKVAGEFDIFSTMHTNTAADSSENSDDNNSIPTQLSISDCDKSKRRHIDQSESSVLEPAGTADLLSKFLQHPATEANSPKQIETEKLKEVTATIRKSHKSGSQSSHRRESHSPGKCETRHPTSSSPPGRKSHRSETSSGRSEHSRSRDTSSRSRGTAKSGHGTEVSEHGRQKSDPGREKSEYNHIGRAKSEHGKEKLDPDRKKSDPGKKESDSGRKKSEHNGEKSEHGKEESEHGRKESALGRKESEHGRKKSESGKEESEHGRKKPDHGREKSEHQHGRKKSEPGKEESEHGRKKSDHGREKSEHGRKKSEYMPSSKHPPRQSGEESPNRKESSLSSSRHSSELHGHSSKLSHSGQSHLHSKAGHKEALNEPGHSRKLNLEQYASRHSHSPCISKRRRSEPIKKQEKRLLPGNSELLLSPESSHRSAQRSKTISSSSRLSPSRAGKSPEKAAIATLFGDESSDDDVVLLDTCNDDPRSSVSAAKPLFSSPIRVESSDREMAEPTENTTADIDWNDDPFEVDNSDACQTKPRGAEFTIPKKRVAHPDAAMIRAPFRRAMPSAQKTFLSPAEQMHNRLKLVQQKKLMAAASSTPRHDHSGIESLNAPTKVRVAHAAKWKDKEREERTPVQTSKFRAREAHVPKEKVLSRPIIPSEFGCKVATSIRQRYLNQLIDECLNIYNDQQAAFDRALHEEKAIYERSSSRVVYLNVAVKAIRVLRTEVASQAGTSCQPRLNRTWSHEAVLGGAKAAKTTFTLHRSGHGNIKDQREVKLTLDVFSQYLQQYILTEDQLRENGFPMVDRENPLLVKFCGVFEKTPTKGLKLHEKICSRCGKRFRIYPDGTYATKEECFYHWGRAYKRKISGQWDSRYMCCSGDISSEPCCIGKYHVHDTNKSADLENYVKTYARPPTSDGHGVYALDCEMVNTVAGFELARVTVIDMEMETVYESLVKPSSEVIDYNTRFSGLEEGSLDRVETTIADVQNKLRRLFSEKTILIGHSLESDFTAMKLIHDTVVDTSVVFPHRLGPPYKRALRNLMGEILKKIIQNDVGGHDSKEDAAACMELMVWKVKEELRVKH